MSDAEKWRVSEHSLFGKRYIHLERWINSPAHWTIVAVVPVSDIDAASRLALARALVPGWAVVPVEPTVAMLQDGDMAIRRARPGGVSGMTIEAQTKAECARAGACWAAMLTAAEEPPHGP